MGHVCWPYVIRNLKAQTRYSLPQLSGVESIVSLAVLERGKNICKIIFSQKVHPGLFSYFNSFQTIFQTKNCKLRQDSNLDRWSKRQARWPFAHHHHGQLLKQFYERLALPDNIHTFNISTPLLPRYLPMKSVTGFRCESCSIKSTSWLHA